MKKGLKFLILIAILAIPSLIFIFLHSFGENKFDVAIQHPEGLEIEGCTNNSVPFQVPEIDSLSVVSKGFKVVFIPNDQLAKEQVNFWRRLSQNNREVEFILLYESKDSNLNLNDYMLDNSSAFMFKNQTLQELNHCVFGNIVDENSLVLIDPQMHVRGYYELTDKELDRLEAEITILTE